MLQIEYKIEYSLPVQPPSTSHPSGPVPKASSRDLSWIRIQHQAMTKQQAGRSWVIKCPHFSHHPTMIGIWSIMATIRWCPIFPKWDTYQPLSIPLRVCRPERTSSRLGNPELGNRWSDRHGQTPGVRRCVCPARLSAEGWGIIGYWVQNSANMYKYHQGSIESCPASHFDSWIRVVWT